MQDVGIRHNEYKWKWSANTSRTMNQERRCRVFSQNQRRLPLDSIHIRRELFIRGNGRVASDMVKAQWSGQIKLDMKASGNSIRHAALVNSTTLMAIYMRDSG